MAQSIKNGIGVVRSKENLSNASDNSKVPFAGRGLLHQGVQAGLLLQRTREPVICRQQRHSTDRPTRCPSLRQQSVDDERLMSTMEVTHPDVHDADDAISPYVRRELHIMR